MKVLYHITLTPPRIPGTDAVYQEVELLNKKFGTEIIRWYPFSHYTPYIPPFFFGLHNLVDVWKKERDCDIHHIFHSIWYPFPLLFLLRKPIVFTVAGGLAYSLQYSPMKKIHLVLPSEHERHGAEERGWKNTSFVFPGIDTGALIVTPPPKRNGEFVLLAGSSPWEKTKFVQKGFDLMLKIIKQNAFIRLITLWRGILYEEWRDMIEEFGVQDRVEVYNTWVDIAAIMPRVHAAIVLADRGGIVKAWPHSLLEALTAGRPVMISRSIPMASFVQEQGNGIIIETMEYNELEQAIQTLIRDYERYQNSASQTGHLFSSTRNIAAYQDIYTKVLTERE
jgi:glycosyltransferase involved in cell wall biosynthesis